MKMQKLKEGVCCKQKEIMVKYVSTLLQDIQEGSFSGVIKGGN